MGLILWLSVCIFTIGSTPAIVSAAQDIYDAPLSGEEVGLEKIIVTNRRAPISIGDSTENVTVLSESQLAHLPARNLGEVLSYITGLNIEPRQGFGRGTSVSIQGSDSRQVKVMIDGIPLNNQASGQVDLSRFPIENIAAIEVIKGPASSVWGSALGGVINVITKDTGTTAIPHVKYTVSFAEFRTRRHSADLSGKMGSLGYYFSSSYMESGGRSLRDDVLEHNAFSKFSFESEQMGKVIASFGYNGAAVNSGIFPDGSWQAQPYRARYGKIDWRRDYGNADIDVGIKHARQDIITKSFLSVDDTDAFSTVMMKDALYQLGVNSRIHPRGKDLLVIGADFDLHRLKSSYLNKAKSISLEAPYLNYTRVLYPWDFNFGLRFDRNSEFGEELSPSLGALYHLEHIADTSLRLEISRAFNAPPLLWKHYELILSGLTTNPDIKPERAWVYELGLETKPVPSLWVKLSFYRAIVSDAIALASNDAGKFFMKNFEKFRRQGVELQSRINVTEDLSFLAQAAFNDIEDRVSKEIVRGGGKPRQSFGFGIEYKNKDGLGVYLRGYYDRWNEPALSAPNDRKMLFDANISQQVKNVKFFVNIYNISDSKYWADYFFPVPRRYFEGGISLQW